MLRRRFFCLLLVVPLALAAACNSPTLPLPPPALPTMSASPEPGKVHLSSDDGAEPNAIIVIINTNPNVGRDRNVGGATADAQGSWFTDIYGADGDVVEISQEFGTTKSAPVRVVLKTK
ncbi:hypothetical protein BH09MYX1_BH09MYX1_52540 [soil metagenome]